MTNHTPRYLIAGLGLLLLFGCRTPDRTDTTTEPVPVATVSDPLARGQQAYQQYCQSCHGPDGTGIGELQNDLATPAADLTTLAERNDGVFPATAVYEMIDGRHLVEAHGTREMPVWGNVWTDVDGEPISEEVVEARINELVEYVRTLQTVTDSASRAP